MTTLTLKNKSTAINKTDTLTTESTRLIHRRKTAKISLIKCEEDIDAGVLIMLSDNGKAIVASKFRDGRVIGMAKSSGKSGDVIQYAEAGLMEGAYNLDASKNYAYLGTNGNPTTTPPTNGNIVVVGVVKGANSFLLQIQDEIMTP